MVCLARGTRALANPLSGISPPQAHPQKKKLPKERGGSLRGEPRSRRSQKQKTDEAILSEPPTKRRSHHPRQPDNPITDNPNQQSTKCSTLQHPNGLLSCGRHSQSGACKATLFPWFCAAPCPHVSPALRRARLRRRRKRPHRRPKHARPSLPKPSQHQAQSPRNPQLWRQHQPRRLRPRPRPPHQ